MKKLKHPTKTHLLPIILFLIITLPVSASDLQYNPEKANKILNTFFPKNLIIRLKTDAAPILKYYDEINIFSSAHYGTPFMTGETDIGDIFDARIPQNLEIFRTYARKNNLIQNLPEQEHYNRYAKASTRFLREYAYEAVLFHPDEFHPLFTKPRDTWLFLVDTPDNPPDKDNRYYTGRVTKRKQAVTGGITMEPVNLPSFCHFYKTRHNETYTPYQLHHGKTIETSEHPHLIDPHTPYPVTPDILKKRQSIGIIPSPLSHTKNLKVGTWGLSDDWHHRVGISFGGREDIYTWGDQGVYLLPLDTRFWK